MLLNFSYKEKERNRIDMKKLLRKSCGAFTMAEILISLTIIGVIAAITLPSLRANINEKTWATQKKALLSRMSQAVAMLDSQNTYQTAQRYVTEGLSSVLKINNICDHDNLADCGIVDGTIITTKGGTFNFPKTWVDLGYTKFATNTGTELAPVYSETGDQIAAFETANGESVVVFYNPQCIPSNDDAPAVATGDDAPEMYRYVCANIIYDLNQDKGPNTVGKDIGFMTVLYAADSSLATFVPTATTLTAAACTADDMRAPSLDEAVAMQLNWKLMTDASAAAINTSGRGVTSAGATVYYQLAADQRLSRNGLSAAPTTFNCVKR